MGKITSLAWEVSLRAVGVAMAVVGSAACSSQQDSNLIEYSNATWWDGKSEQTGSRFVRGDRFAEPGDFVPATVIDLQGALVTAPFAEGHNHNLVETIFDRSNEEYLRNGVFYVKIPTAYPPAIRNIRDDLSRPDTVDANFSMGGLTCPGGHPVNLFVNVLSESIYEGASYEDFSGQAFHEVTSTDEVGAAIDTMARNGTDFVKALILYSENHRDSDYSARPRRGLDPNLLPAVVAEAHARSLPVVLHVNSAADFRAGVASGVDEIAHLPGIGWGDDRTAEEHRLTPEDAERAAKAGVAVVTSTLVTLVAFRDRPDRVAEFKAMQRHNLALLIDAGVEIRIGSDLYDRRGTGVGADPTRGEVENLVELGVYDATTALVRWIDTGRKIFPDRDIACFEAGCEASFLVFAEDPRIDITNLDSLELAVKQGVDVFGSLPE